jgi:hypothetical protein
MLPSRILSISATQRNGQDAPPVKVRFILLLTLAKNEPRDTVLIITNLWGVP